MNTKLFDKTSDELFKDYYTYSDEINSYNEKIKLSKYNLFESKLKLTLLNSILPYILLVLSTTKITKRLGVNLITDVYSAIFVPLTITIMSVFIGSIIKDVIYKKNNINSKISKPEYEKIEEQIAYEIELEKANNREKAVEKAIQSFRENKVYLPFFSKRYVMKKKLELDPVEQEKEKFEEASIIVDEKKEELDIASMKKVIGNRLFKYRAKNNQQRKDLILCLGFILSVVSLNTLSLFLLGNCAFYNSLFESIIPTVVPLVSSTVLSKIYILKRNNDYSKALNNINVKLGKDKILVSDPKKTFLKSSDEIREKINSLSIATLQFERQKRKVESVIEESTQSSEQHVSNEINLYCNDNNIVIGGDEMPLSYDGIKLIKRIKHKA